jgi:PII-like signaling protein
MHIEGDATLLRVFIGEADKLGHKALFDVIVEEARAAGLAGATVLRGIQGFGLSAKMRSSRILDLSSDLPVVVEIVDEAEKVAAFTEILNDLLEKADSGGLVTVEKAHVIRYLHGASAGRTDD